jgi:HSP20 family protein
LANCSDTVVKKHMSKSSLSSGVRAAPGQLTVRPVSSATLWVPNTDVYVTEHGVVVHIELAGVHKEDMQLVMEGDLLKISGQRQDTNRPGKCKFRMMEINYGPFETVIELPPGYDLAQARASYQNGFLRIEVPPQAPDGAGSSRKS